MIDTSVTLQNSSAVNLFLKQMPEHFNSALETAINETAKAIKAESKKIVPKEWGIKKEAAQDAKIKKASISAGSAVAEVLLGGKKTPFWNFGSVSPRNVMSGKTTGGVSVLIAGNSYQFKHAFVTNMDSRNVGVYERIKGKYIETSRGRREATRHLSSTSFAKMAKSKKTNIPNSMQAKAQEIFEQKFIAQCDLFLNSARL